MKIHELDGYIQSTYLVEYEDRLLMFDSGTKADVEPFLEYIRDFLKRPISDLKLIFVSHMHPDHSGGARYLKKKTGCKIAAPKFANNWYKGIGGKFEHIIDILLTHYVANKKKKDFRFIYFPSIIDVDYELETDERLPGFEDWKVISTFGHTTCDMSLVHENSRNIYIADDIVQTSKGFIPPYPLYDPKHYQKVLAQYSDMSEYDFLLAHGGIIPWSEIDFDYLNEKISKYPRTHLEFLKRKVFRIN